MRPALVIALVAVLALGACGSDSEGRAGLDWSATADPIGADAGLAWADRETGDIHFSDGSTLAGDRAIGSFVVAGAGAYAVDADDELVEITPGGTRSTGAHVTKGLKASPSGRYLAFVDPQAAPADEGDARLLTSVVVDLETGRELFRSTEGMGDPDEDDLTDLYEDADYGALAVTDKTAWINVPDGYVQEIDLSTGKATHADGDDPYDDANPWANTQLTPPTIGGPANSEGTWGIYHVSRPVPNQSTDPAVLFPANELESADGGRVVPQPDAENWYFEQWVDDDTVAGFADTGLDDPNRVERTKKSSLLTCTVPDGACTLVPDSQNAILPEPSLL